MSAFVISKIFPSMNIDANQRFIFGLEGSPEPLGSFKLDNIYIPLIGSPSQTNYEMRNQALSGYRWIHTTQSTETYGSLKLQRFLTGSSTGIDIMTFNDDGSFIIPGFNDAKYIIQQPDTNLPNAQTLSTLTTGLLKNTTTTGVLSIALPGIDYLPMSGGTLTGDLILNGDPANPLGAVTRQYADAISQGLNFKNSCYVGTTSNLTATYANGTSGVGATLTNSGTLAVFSVDGVTPPLNSRILVKNQTSGFQNGIYTLTNVGSVSIAWVLTRASDYNQTVEIKPGDFIIVDNGTINTRTGWVQTATINTIGTDNLTFSAFGTVGTAPNSAKYIIQTADSSLPNAQVLGSLVGGILKNTNITGVLSIAIPAIDYFAPDVNSNLNLNSHKVVNLLDPTNAQDAATKAYVDSAIDNTFGPSVALPFVQLDFNWNNASGSDPFIFNNYLVNTSPSLRQYVHRVSAISGGTRKWEIFYDLGDPTTPHGIIQFQFSHPAGSPVDFVPFKIEIFGPSWNPFIYINATLSLNGILDMGAHRIGNVADPVFDQDAVNKLYVTNTINTSINASTLTLTGSVTGSGNINGSLATSFSNIQTVSGNTQTFNYSNALTSSIFSLTNTNPSAVTRFRASGGASGDYVELVYDAFNGYSYINLANASNDRLVFMANGTPLAALLYTGLFGIGTLTPTSGKLQINGGVQNIANEETAIRVISALNSVKFELQCTSGTGRLYELRSTNTGSFDITDRTGSRTLYTLDSNANHIFNTVGTLFAKRPTGYLYMSNNATAGTTVANTWVKVAGTTTLSGVSNLFDMPVSNRLRYTGTPTLTNGTIQVSLTITYNSIIGTRIGFSIFKNGSLLADTPKYITNNNINASMMVSLNAATSFATNDYIEIYFNSPNGGVGLTATDLSITVE